MSSARIGLLAHGFRRFTLHHVPLPSPTNALSGSDEGTLPTYSGGTAPVFHRTSLLCPVGHPRDYSVVSYATYLSGASLSISNQGISENLRTIILLNYYRDYPLRTPLSFRLLLILDTRSCDIRAADHN